MWLCPFSSPSLFCCCSCVVRIDVVVDAPVVNAPAVELVVVDAPVVDLAAAAAPVAELAAAGVIAKVAEGSHAAAWDVVGGQR